MCSKVIFFLYLNVLPFRDDKGTQILQFYFIYFCILILVK